MDCIGYKLDFIFCSALRKSALGISQCIVEIGLLVSQKFAFPNRYLSLRLMSFYLSHRITRNSSLVAVPERPQPLLEKRIVSKTSASKPVSPLATHVIIVWRKRWTVWMNNEHRNVFVNHVRHTVFIWITGAQMSRNEIRDAQQKYRLQYKYELACL